MKSIIITGKQGVGKTELARLIAKDKETLEIQKEIDLKYITNNTKVIIFDAIESEKDFVLFTELSTKTRLRIRPPYQKNEIEIDCSKILLIGVSISPIECVRDSFIYNLY